MQNFSLCSPINTNDKVTHLNVDINDEFLIDHDDDRVDYKIETDIKTGTGEYRINSRNRVFCELRRWNGN